MGTQWKAAPSGVIHFIEKGVPACGWFGRDTTRVDDPGSMRPRGVYCCRCIEKSGETVNGAMVRRR